MARNAGHLHSTTMKPVSSVSVFWVLHIFPIVAWWNVLRRLPSCCERDLPHFRRIPIHADVKHPTDAGVKMTGLKWSGGDALVRFSSGQYSSILVVTLGCLPNAPCAFFPYIYRGSKTRPHFRLFWVNNLATYKSITWPPSTKSWFWGGLLSFLSAQFSGGGAKLLFRQVAFG